MRSDKDSISLFFPAYNDESSIEEVVTSFYQKAKEFIPNVEVIVINDGSKDNTAEVLDTLRKKIPDMMVVNHEKNMGYGAALQSGFKHCHHDLIFYTDGDGQYRCNDLPALLAALTDEVDIVNGYKIKRNDSFLRYCTGKAYKIIVSLLFSIQIKDVDCDYRLIRRRIMEGVHFTSNSGVICTEMVYTWQQKGVRFAEIPVHHYSREHGNSQFFTWKHLLNALFGLFVLWFTLHFPLRR